MVVIAQHESLLRQLGLATLEQVRQFRRGDLVKNHRGRRDIFRLRTTQADGRELVLYLKRNLKPYRKDGWASFLRLGQVWSLSRQEWENSRRIEAAGLRVAGLVAYGEECGWFTEKFSYLITESAVGQQTLEQFLRECRSAALRRRVLDALARVIRKLHDAGLASPDLFTRHLFVDLTAPEPAFCLIDMARLDHGRTLSLTQRARDLAALNITAPRRDVATRERVRFLHVYADSRRLDRTLVRRIARRVDHLLKRRKFRNFADTQASNP